METIWQAIVEADLQRHLVAAQLVALRTAALASGQADPMTGAIADVTAEVRTAVESCAKNRLSSDTTTVPPELRSAGTYLVIAQLQGRLPSLRLTEDQKESIEEAREKLKLVAKCGWAVSAPSEALEPRSTQSGGGASVVDADTDVRTATRSQMDGL